MANPNWGMLAKSQDDAETIEEAIARLISAHNEDSEAHLSEGGSLQSHAASEIIDHLADSIIADKISDRTVSPEKLNFSKFSIIPSFESLDCYGISKTGTGANVALYGGGCVIITCGTSVGNKSVLRNDNDIQTTNPDLKPVLQFSVVGYNDIASDFCGMLCALDPFNVSYHGIGFFFDGSDQKIYGRYGYDDYPNTPRYKFHDTLLANYSPQHIVFRVEVDRTIEKIKWYIDGELVATDDITGKSLPDTDVNFSFGVQNDDAGSNDSVYIFNVVFFEDWDN